MVLAEKIVTAIARGSANTRWRDFVDIHELVRRHDIDGRTLRESVLRRGQHREVAPVSLRLVLADYAALAQRRWLAWLKKAANRIEGPSRISTVLDLVALFADPVIAAEGPLGRGMQSRGAGCPIDAQTSAKACTDIHIRRFCRSISELRKGLIRRIKT